MKVIAIVGSRGFNDYSMLERFIKMNYPISDVSLIVSGGANGADSLAEVFARENGIPIEVLKPDWKTFGKSAGIRRNVEIVSQSDIVFAFWDGNSKGTAFTIKEAQRQNKSIFVKQY